MLSWDSIDNKLSSQNKMFITCSPNSTRLLVHFGLIRRRPLGITLVVLLAFLCGSIPTPHRTGIFHRQLILFTQIEWTRNSIKRIRKQESRMTQYFKLLSNNKKYFELCWKIIFTHTLVKQTPRTLTLLCKLIVKIQFMCKHNKQ